MKKEKYNILYVDDEPSNIRIFKAIFDRHYNVYTAISGIEGLKLLEQYPIMLVISDQRMPEMTGLEFLKRVKLKWKNIKSIILSAYSDIEVIKSAFNDIEIFRYVNKPFNHKDLKILIDLALELHQSKIDKKRESDILHSKVEKFYGIFKSISDVFTRVNNDGFVEIISPSIYELLGYKPEEIIGKKSLNYYVNKEDRVKFFQIIKNDGFCNNFETAIYTKDKKIVYVLVSARIHRDKDGKPIGIDSLVRDVTDFKLQQKTLIENELKLRNFFDIAPVGIALSNMQGEFIEVNREFSKFTGYSIDELIKLSSKELTPEEFASQDQDHFNLLIQNSTYGPYYKEYIHKNGHRFPVLLNGVKTIGQNNEELIWSVVQDISWQKKAEETIENQRERLVLATSAANQGIWDWDVLNNVLDWDDLMYNLYRVKKSDFTGAYEAWASGLHPDDKEMSDNEVQAALRGEKKFDCEFRIVWPDQSVRHIHAVATVIRNKQGEPIRMIGVNWDITEVKEALEEIKKLNEELEERVLLRTEELIQEKNFSDVLINSLPGIFSLISEDGNHIRWNNNHEKVTGYSPEEYKHLNAFDFFSETNKKDFMKEFLQLHGKNEMKLEVNLSTKSGNVIPYFFTGLKIDIDNKKYLSAMGIDISERKLLEEELVKSKEEADKANSAKSDFLANMSHEIRTPMNAILGFSEILSKRIKDPDHIEFLASIQSSGRTLLKLINNILDLSKIESGKLDFSYEPANIKKLIQEVVGMFRLKCEDKNLSMNLILSEEVPDVLYIDELRMKQILINLINNSLKFTEKGYIEIEVSTKNISDESLDLILKVKDSGIGIPKKFHKKIFNAFNQLDKFDNKKYEGTGLGLAITQQLVKQMKGEITVESSVGKGSIFTISLKKIKISKESPPSLQRIEFDPDSILFEDATVLIVDDVKSNRDVLRGYMMDYKINCIEAENGHEAIISIKKTKPDLIFLDLRMPIMDGYEAIKFIKKNSNWSTIPIVAITASAFDKDVKKVLAIGFNEYLSKPISLNEIIELLMKYLKYTISTIHKEVIAEVTYKPIAKLDEVLLEIDNKIIPVWEEIKNVRKKKKVLLLGSLLIEIGEKYKAKPLVNYGKELLSASQFFNVDKEMKLIHQFPDFIKKLNSLNN